MWRCAVTFPLEAFIGHSVTAVGHRIYSFGGYSTEEQINVYIFNTVSLRWSKLPQVTSTGEHYLAIPDNRIFHTATLIGDVVYVWGGRVIDGDLCNNMLYAFDVNTHRWLNTDVSGTVPEARVYHSACGSEKDMYIYGGETEQTLHADIYKLDTNTMVWSLINDRCTSHCLLLGQSATIMGTKLFVYGGILSQEERLYIDISVYDTEKNCWLDRPSAQVLPEARYGHSAFAYNGELYMFGGLSCIDAKLTFNDVWKFSPQTFSWKEVTPKTNDPYWMGWNCCCIVGERVIIFGVKQGNTCTDNLYVVDLNPSLKMLCKLAVILYGLDQSELPQDIRWELDAMSDQNTTHTDWWLAA